MSFIHLKCKKNIANFYPLLSPANAVYLPQCSLCTVWLYLARDSRKARPLEEAEQHTAAKKNEPSLRFFVCKKHVVNQLHDDIWRHMTIYYVLVSYAILQNVPTCSVLFKVDRRQWAFCDGSYTSWSGTWAALVMYRCVASQLIHFTSSCVWCHFAPHDRW